MATVRRLSDEDVRAVFDCVHRNEAPSKSLEFRIVPVGPDGLKLSPPSYEFEDGLYILLKPEKKKSKGSPQSPTDQPKVPSNLVHAIFREFPAASCPWSLSGPQFPQPTKIQQRYCYPKGDPSYSRVKGGALWTMYGDDGKEDLEYRLLHVYYSAKRAVNKGVTGQQQRYKGDAYSRKRIKDDKNKKKMINTSDVLSPVTASNSYSSYPSPLSFDYHSFASSSFMDVPPSPSLSPESPSSQRQEGSTFVTPEHGWASPQSGRSASANDGSTNYHYTAGHNNHNNLHPGYQYSHHHMYHGEHQPVHRHGTPHKTARPFPPPPPVTSHGMAHPSHITNRRDKAHHTTHSSQPREPDVAMLEFEAFWTEPIPLQRRGSKSLDDDGCSMERVEAFSTKLDIIHGSISDKIREAPENEQAHLLNMFSSWAKRVSQDPMCSNVKATSSTSPTRDTLDTTGHSV